MIAKLAMLNLPPNWLVSPLCSGQRPWMASLVLAGAPVPRTGEWRRELRLSSLSAVRGGSNGLPGRLRQSAAEGQTRPGSATRPQPSRPTSKGACSLSPIASARGQPRRCDPIHSLCHRIQDQRSPRSGSGTASSQVSQTGGLQLISTLTAPQPPIVYLDEVLP